MYGVLPGAVFDGAPLTPPRGVVKSTWGNHQLSPGLPMNMNIQFLKEQHSRNDKCQ